MRGRLTSRIWVGKRLSHDARAAATFNAHETSVAAWISSGLAFAAAPLIWIVWGSPLQVSVKRISGERTTRSDALLQATLKLRVPPTGSGASD